MNNAANRKSVIVTQQAPLLKAAHDQWKAFEGSMRRSLQCAIALGKELVALKEAVPHGQFGRYFQDSKDPVQDPLPFNRHWAARLMVLAGHPVLSGSNVYHGIHLPAELNTLYELATLPQPALEAAIEAGRITPDLTRAEVKALKREISPKAVVEKPQPKRDDVWFECRNTISDAIDSAIALFPDLDWEIKSHINFISRTLERAYDQRRNAQPANAAMPSAGD